jgi:hypothetical protein
MIRSASFGPLQKVVAGRARPNVLAADFTHMLISIRRRSAGAKRQSPKASIDELSFRGRQLTSTLANQYSLVFHVFLLSSLLSPLSGPKTSNKKNLATSGEQ